MPSSSFESHPEGAGRQLPVGVGAFAITGQPWLSAHCAAPRSRRRRPDRGRGLQALRLRHTIHSVKLEFGEDDSDFRPHHRFLPHQDRGAVGFEPFR